MTIHSRWYDSKRTKFLLCVLGILVPTGIGTFVFDAIRFFDEAHIINTVCASERLNQHIETIIDNKLHARDSMAIFDHYLLLEISSPGAATRAHALAQDAMARAKP